MKTRTHSYYGVLGQFLAAAAKVALEQASRKRQKIARYQGRRHLKAHRFQLLCNEAWLPLLEGDVVDDVVARYMAIQAAREEAYRQDPKRVAEAARRESVLQKAHADTVALVAELDSVIDSPMPELMEWVSRFIKAAAYHGVDYDATALVARFEQAGYKANAYVGEQYKERLQSEPDAMGRYIIGQVLTLITRGIGFPDILGMFIEQYRDLVSELD